MTSPVFHAQSSARLFGGDFEDYLPVHTHLDETKSAFADFRHRALRHHVEHFSMIEQWQDVSPRNDMLTVCQQHCIEDCGGRIPTASDWINEFVFNKDKPWQSKSVIDAQTHASLSAAKYGGQSEDYLAVCEFLTRYQRLLPTTLHAQARLLTHHALGIFDVEAVFGAFIINSRGKPIPTRYIAEQCIERELGCIPTAQAWLEDIQRVRWMSHGTTINQSTTIM